MSYYSRSIRTPRRRSRMPVGSRRFNGFYSAFFVIFILAFLGMLGTEVYAHTHTKTVTFTVQDKTVKYDSNHNSKYLIFTDKGVYQDTDSLWFFKFRSSDLYGQLQRGKTFTCKSYGFRIGLTSAYPNLISCHSA